MNQSVIIEFKSLLADELVSTYSMSKQEAEQAVQGSVINEMLETVPEFIMHQPLEDSVEEVWKQYKGIPIEV